jgi:hypothetical protein
MTDLAVARIRLGPVALKEKFQLGARSQGMFPEVHDNEIVAFSVDSRTESIVLVLSPGNGCEAVEFRLMFPGVVAFQFLYPLLPSIVFNLVELPVADLLAREAVSLAHGHRRSGWPGPWFTSIKAATSYCKSAGLRGFEILESYGMSGWVVARSVERVDPG